MDLSRLSDAELEALASGNVSALPDSTLEYLATGKQPWNLVDAARQFGAGAVEGVTGSIGLASDLAQVVTNPLQLAENYKKGDLFPTSAAIKRQTDKVLPVEDPDYRYSRAIGSFVGPTGATGAAGKALQATGKAPALASWLAKLLGKGEMITSTTGAIGAQAAEDVTGDSGLAPVVGALFGAAGPTVANNIWKVGRSVFRGATPKEIEGSAARALREQTGLVPEQIDAAISKRPDDALGQYMTLAELTDNAGAAQLEKTLTNAGEGARIYNARAMEREGVRNEMLDAMSEVKGIEKETLGTNLINQASAVERRINEAADAAWQEVPRFEPIDVRREHATLMQEIARKQGGLDLDPRVAGLAKQFLADEVATSGKLQDIRSSALWLLREKDLKPEDSRILNVLQKSTDVAAERSLSKDDYAKWLKGRNITRYGAETFKRGTAGGALTEEMARPSSVLASAFKGDSRSVQELKRAINKDPRLIEQVKRGVIDSIGRDTQGNLTAYKMNKFLTANKGGIRELFGEDHTKNMQRIASDLVSEARVGQIAFRSSKGNSVTAQRQTVAGAIKDALLGVDIPFSRTLGSYTAQLRAKVGIQNQQQIEELLLRASLEPDFAALLARKPTKEYAADFLGRIGRLATEATESGAKGATLELAGTDREIQEKPKPQTTPAPERSPLFGGGANKKDPPMLDLPPVNPLAEQLREAVIQQESAGNPKAVSNKGAVGLMQIMPQTAKEIAAELGVEKYDLKDPQTNKLFGTYYLSKMLDRFGNDPELALTAYHSGPNRVAALLEAVGGSRLDDILLRLGPVGQKYARQVLGRMQA